MKSKDNIPLHLREKATQRTSLICSIVVLILAFLFLRQLDYYMIRKPALDARKKAIIEQEKNASLENTPVTTTASILAVGDNLYHQSLLDAYKETDGVWNYDHIYAHVQDEIQAADLAIIDQETPLTSDHSAISTYPRFATPTEVGDAIINAGFDVIEAATNHVDDYGYDILAQTFDFWKNKYPDVPVLGIHETEEDANTIKTVTVNDITIAFLNYTYGTNTTSIDEERKFMIDIFDKDKIASDVKKAKEISDCIIFIAHWGTEDETMPTEYEKQWATYLMQLGVDVVIGGHPHVLQPYGRMFDENGNKMLIFYSLGNFVSTQQNSLELLGGMAKFTIQKTVLNGKTTIEFLEPEVKPLVMHYDKTNGHFGPYMLEDYTEELASQHSIREIVGDEFTLANLKATYEEIMKMNVEPSTDTELLNVTFDWDGKMIDKTTGNYVEDTKSIHSWEYYNKLNNNNESYDSSYDSYYDSYYDSSYDSSYDSYYDSSYDSSYDSYYDSSYDSYYDSY